MYQIISKEQDIAEKWMVRVAITSNESVFFKFEANPSQEEVDAEVIKHLATQELASSPEE
jgi:hypothetical protein